MALEENGGGIPATMLVGPTGVGGTGMPYPVPMYGGMGGQGNGGFGDQGGWWIVLLIIVIAALGGNWGGYNNGGGGFGGGQPIIVNDGGGSSVQRGFDQAAVMGGVNSLQSGISGLSTQLCNCCGDMQNAVNQGFFGVQNALCNGFNGVEQNANTRQIANMQQAFAAQTAMSQGFNQLGSQFADCCCENRLGTADLKYTIATENCADRAAISDGIKDLLTNQTANTQRILDQLCADKIEQKNDVIAQLRSELMYARGQASQDVQTAAIQAGQRALANEVEQYVLPTPRPAYIVQNPNCCAPTNCGCGSF